MKTKFFTGKGDKGKSVMGKCKISKDNELLRLLGEIDALNSWFGLCFAEARTQNAKRKTQNHSAKIKIDKSIQEVQEMLFILQAEIAAIALNISKNTKRITIQHTEAVENIIFAIDKKLPPITKFIITGGSELSARLDYARALCRTLERNVVGYTRRTARHKISPDVLQFLNRLSSVLFALARYANFVLKVKEGHPRY